MSQSSSDPTFENFLFNFHPIISTTHPKPAFHIYGKLLNARLTVPQSHFLITNLYYRINTSLQPVNTRISQHHTEQTQQLLKEFCVILQEPCPSKFNRSIQDLQHEIEKAFEDMHDMHETQQLLFAHESIYNKIQPLHDSLNTVTNDTTSLISNIGTLLTNLQTVLTDSTDMA